MASVLFVCLGNICRSPMAEGAMRAAAEAARLELTVDSAGTAAYHVGEPPDPRAVACAAAHGVDISRLRGRQAILDDFYDFDHIFALDGQNLANLRRIMPDDATATLGLLLDVIPGQEGKPVPDPYYDGEDAFDYTWRLVSAAADAIVVKLQG
ncbi:low molecular weight protein-tyrosine-phosphatase [Erythrobacter sp. EC-HK427]|uniref:low molecular weight protein-tyrosine-phosphatase n=1 Tax=Erythrobacter sp. EC-HK427 TaxID=2038396 RepID=UPI00125ABEA1|nr:low molecular weight protein-tyrosine-phosphatase [Erythrobacter sp. EC-HK427]VVT07582.1 Phosphotyrosine protein phosphatase [Erythrobacter sp. EC-HK427]